MADAAQQLDRTAPDPINETPWQEIFRNTVGQRDTGGCLELATAYRKTRQRLARDNH